PRCYQWTPRGDVQADWLKSPTRRVRKVSRETSLLGLAVQNTERFGAHRRVRDVNKDKCYRLQYRACGVGLARCVSSLKSCCSLLLRPPPSGDCGGKCLHRENQMWRAPWRS